MAVGDYSKGWLFLGMVIGAFVLIAITNNGRKLSPQADLFWLLVLFVILANVFKRRR